MSEQTTSPQTQQPQAASAPVPGGKPAGKGITLADSAVKRLRTLLEQRQTPEAGLRLAVKGGGCSGLQYAMEWAEKPRERDKIFEREGVRVFVDPKSYLYLMGTELIFEESLMGSGFKLQNPNVKSACGCGESFTV
ncbi:MAG: iron-sulfur cluster assembly accessory protein [Myxococcaceae bacterium]|nr:iron-sulfur cluster assembly accessory protein [Myxococcaceae bacterium]